jgi:predicted CDP-diglyceride synthetase/phosphatidate cytidylyltransferase
MEVTAKWLNILGSSGIFVPRVEASKEGLLAGPLETVVVLTLAWFFLKEKLRKMQLIGVIIALSGFSATVLSSSLQLSY